MVIYSTDITIMQYIKLTHKLYNSVLKSISVFIFKYYQFDKQNDFYAVVKILLNSKQ